MVDPVDAANIKSIYGCLALFTAEETLDDVWDCVRCKQKTRATKSLSLWRLSDVLIVHLKRFSYENGHREKLDGRIDFPLDGLDMSMFVSNPEHASCIYDLYAVANHYGAAHGGHYTAYARDLSLHKQQPSSEAQWVEFDDDRVRPISSSSIVVLLFCGAY